MDRRSFFKKVVGIIDDEILRNTTYVTTLKDVLGKI